MAYLWKCHGNDTMIGQCRSCLKISGNLESTSWGYGLKRETCWDYSGNDSCSSHFGEPLRWIGMYIAAASLVCVLLLALDLVRSFSRGKWWVASKFFTFNAATLTILAVATKLPTNIGHEMDVKDDFITKICGICLMMSAMSHAMPSLGLMDGASVVPNILALGILVITLFVNICFQIHVGLFQFQDISGYLMLVFSLFMLFLFEELVSHSLSVQIIRRNLQGLYKSRHREIVEERSSSHIIYPPVETLKEYVLKYWLMAVTCSPDYALRHSVMIFLALAPNCLFISYILILFSSHDPIVTTHSSYGWTAKAIVFIQAIAIFLGAITSICRALNFDVAVLIRMLYKIETHHFQLLLEWREAPVLVRKRTTTLRKVARAVKDMGVYTLIAAQFVVVIQMKLFLLIAFIPLVILIKLLVEPLVWLMRRLVYFVMRCGNARLADDDGSDDYKRLHHYILYLEKPEPMELEVRQQKKRKQDTKLIHKCKNHLQKYFEKGRVNKAHYLLRLLQRTSSTTFEGFTEVCSLYYSEGLLPESSPVKPFDCWALPLVTLTAVIRIAFADGIETAEATLSLMAAVSQGLQYVRVVDANLAALNGRRVREASELVWDGIQSHGQWLGVQTLPGNYNNYWRSIMGNLRSIADQHYKTWSKANPHELTPKLLAADCLHRITENISSLVPENSDSLAAFAQLERTVADLLGACLINLPEALLALCSSGALGTHEDAVRDAAIMVGEAEDILQFLEEKMRTGWGSYPDRMQYLNSWCVR